MEDMLTVDDAARFLQISPKTLRNWVAYKKIPYYKVGGAIRFKTVKLEAWLRRREFEEAEFSR